MKRLAALATAFALGGVARDASAIELGPPGEPLSLEVHGFVSQGFILSTHNNYLAKSRKGSFEFTEVGLNFTVPLTERLRTGMQLFARDLGPLGNYSAKMDWFYLDYRIADWLGFRAGRVKIPFGLYNETSDADMARVPVLLPQSVYPTQNRDFLLAQTGVELYGFKRLGGAGALDYRIYGGTIYLDRELTASSTIQLQELTVPYVVGGRLMWETPLDGLRVGGSIQAVRLDTRLIAPTVPPTPVTVSIPAVLWVASAEYAAHDVLVATEYSRWHTKTESSLPAVFPATSAESDRFYGMAAYRVTEWFQPGAHYSLLSPNVPGVSGRAAIQHDVAATLRFDVNPHWLVKLEGHYMVGTAGLNASLNDSVPTSALQRHWGVFMAKTTAYF